MNLFFSKIVFILAFLLTFLDQGYSINLNAIYVASCAREVGVILKVEKDKIFLLAVDGKIKTISRYDVIYIAYYPVGDFPVSEVSNSNILEGITIKSVHNDGLKELVSGWPVEFTEDRISVLNFDGKETVVNREDIWQVDFFTPKSSITFTGNILPYRFEHPYPFISCPLESVENTRKVFPQQLLGDRLIIKRELDRLMMGYLKIKDYNRDQRFYSVPQVYINETTLGLWGNIGSRYGKSAKRPNSFIPTVTSKLSEGPFGFQRILVTGSAPLFSSIHEEPQTQIFYGLKADYLQFSLFYDLERVLIGEGAYSWQSTDMDRSDARFNEMDHISSSIDYGYFSLGGILSSMQYGFRHKEFFANFRGKLSIFKLSFKNYKFNTDLYHGSIPLNPNNSNQNVFPGDPNSEPDFRGQFLFSRLNLNMNRTYLNPKLSLIYRKINFHRDPDKNQAGEFKYNNNSLTVAFYGNKTITEDIICSSYISLEYISMEAGLSSLDTKNSKFYPKGGLNFSLSF